MFTDLFTDCRFTTTPSGVQYSINPDVFVFELDAGISGSDSAVLLTSAQSRCDIRSITTSTFRQHHETFGLDLRNISVPKDVATDLPQIEDMSGYSTQIIKMLMSKMGMSEGVFLSCPFNCHPIAGMTVDGLRASGVYNNYYILFVFQEIV